LQQFYRIGNEDTRKTNGTGLGLYIVKKIVDGHKGSIVIKDNVPKGTSISIHYFANKSKPMRILLVEDEEHIRKVIKVNLEIEGYEVIATDNGRKALEIIENQHFELTYIRCHAA
jgi:hypothetical protein